MNQRDGVNALNARTFMRVFACASAAVLASFLWQGRYGFNLWDEGFLWYGVQRTLAGEVPLKDFMSYEPGRYYLSALMLKLLGNQGLYTLRIALALLQALAVFLGLLLIARSTKNLSFPFIFVCSITLISWMFTRHKAFDIAPSVAAVATLAFMAAAPSLRRYFWGGAVIGLAAVFGRNHGLYGSLGSVALIAYLGTAGEVRSVPRAYIAWLAGALVGFAPFLFLALLDPGFLAAFKESMAFIFKMKATNLPLPVPWPWRAQLAGVPFNDAARALLAGLFFLGLLTYGILLLVFAVIRRVNKKGLDPVLLGSAFMTLPYAHVAFSRADAGHLAQGLFPMLIGLLAIFSRLPAKAGWPLALLLSLSSVFLTLPYQPRSSCNAGCVETEVGGGRFYVTPQVGEEIGLLKELEAKHAPDGKTFLAAPFWPGAYALLERKAPVWEIYALFPRERAFQQAEIDRLEAAKPGFALIVDLPLDGREDLRFRNTHPLIYSYITSNFVPLSGVISGVTQNNAYLIYKRAD